jgi:SAM-dependent methyltransferase
LRTRPSSSTTSTRRGLPSTRSDIPSVVPSRAFRTGEGVPWGAHDERLFCGVAAFYHNAYAASLVPQWLPALDGVAEHLERGAKVADIGCGHGHSIVLMAEAFPNSTFFGIDPHEPSILAAIDNAAGARVSDRVSFSVGTAVDYPEQGFDLICFFDCLHDLGDPVGAARHARSALADRGTVMLVEPYAADRVEDNEGPISASTTPPRPRSAARTRSRRAAGTCSAPRPGRHGSPMSSPRPASPTGASPRRPRST